MEDTLSTMLLSTLPDTPKKPRASNRTAKRIVKNIVKGKTTKISAEQGFRNYLKYTDPLLQESDETTDQSKYADDIEKIINLVNPAEENISKSAQKYLRKEPIDNADISSEIQPFKITFVPHKKPFAGENADASSEIQPMSLFTSSTPAKPSKKASIEIYKSPAQIKKEYKKEMDLFEAEVKQRRKEQNKSATAIQSAVRRKIQEQNAKEEKSATVIQSAVRNFNTKKEAKNQEQQQKIQQNSQKIANKIETAVKTKMAKYEMLEALKEKKQTLNKLNKTLDDNFYKRGKDKKKPEKTKK